MEKLTLKQLQERIAQNKPIYKSQVGNFSAEELGVEIIDDRPEGETPEETIKAYQKILDGIHENEEKVTSEVKDYRQKFEQEKSEKEKLQQEIKTLSEKLEAKPLKETEKDEQINKLQSQLSELQSKGDETQTLQEKIEALNKSLEEKEQFVNSVRESKLSKLPENLRETFSGATIEQLDALIEKQGAQGVGKPDSVIENSVLNRLVN